jgi:hypothetical protein
MKRNNWMGLAAIIVLGLAVGGYFQMRQGNSDAGFTSGRAIGGETRRVRMPERYPSLRAQLAYMAAQKYPQLMDKIYCYCRCDRPPSNHKSLLSCFTDYHALS